MEQYHGTNNTSANLISSGNINVNVGGGELGKGFYTRKDVKGYNYDKRSGLH